ncbi:MAG: hypothetical protein GYA21_08985 [Myxococcales bacterium]|nr:hypothetical protein [Myxococcales bacterium]
MRARRDHAPLVLVLLALSGLCPSPAGAAEVALVEDADGSINNAIVTPNVYLSKAACAFYQSHPDRYDALFVFTSIPQNFMTNVQQGWTVKQYQQGIGRVAYDQTAAFCSGSGRLRMTVKMGDLNILPADPDDRYTGIPFYALSGIQLMGHEFGHHWLAAVTFQKEDGIRHCLLRGFEPSGEPQSGDCDGYQPGSFNQHWSYYFNSGSLMYGSMIEDQGGGSFRLTYANPKYSPLDQYLMGLRAPEEVGPLFLVDTGDLSGSASLPIQPGQSATVQGVRVDFTVQDIIRAEGPRVPEREPCHWKAAFLIVHAAGTPPSAADIERVERYRLRWERFYDEATDQRGSFDTTLAGTGAGTPTCPAGETPDGGLDGGYDGAADAGDDAGADAADGGADAGADPGSDASVDGGADAGRDAGEDAGSDAGLDAGGDSGAGSGSGCGCGSVGGPAGLLSLGLLLGLRRRR